MPRIKLLPENNVRKGFADAHQVEAICRHLRDDIADAVRFAFQTGWRRSEVFACTWAQVDWNGSFVRLEPGTTKTGEGRAFPITPALRAILERRLMPTRRPQPSQTWRTFLANHVHDLVSIDFFTVPTALLRVPFVLVVLAHHRRRIVHFNVTEHPTAGWTVQQIVAAFPDDSAPSYLLRDRDQVYGQLFRRRVKGMRIEEVLTAPHSPWQNPFVERLIGSIRRECLNHVLVLDERHLRRILTRYLTYYHQARTHLALDKDAPDIRPIARLEAGTILEVPEVGGLHHRYLRRAA